MTYDKFGSGVASVVSLLTALVNSTPLSALPETMLPLMIVVGAAWRPVIRTTVPSLLNALFCRIRLTGVLVLDAWTATPELAWLISVELLMESPGSWNIVELIWKYRLNTAALPLLLSVELVILTVPLTLHTPALAPPGTRQADPPLPLSTLPA